jgi:glycosyltransferase involved in cell wall biosynthesis
VSSSDLNLSVIIPTYNRAACLKRALASAVSLDYLPEGFEIIVVDNGSTDPTRAVVSEARNIKPSFRLHYVKEDRLGLHNARHAGVLAATGEILIFTDDDATFETHWLRAYAQAFASHPDMAAAGGPVRPRWEVPPPEWLVDFIGAARTFGMYSLMEPFDEFRLSGEQVFFGVNMAIRAKILKEVGGFNPEAFGSVWLGDGETGLNYKLWARGMLVGYVPDAIVYHHIPAERMTMQYLRARAANQGACDLYSDYQRSRPHAGLLLARACRLLMTKSHSWATAALLKNRTDIASVHIQLDAARTKSQLRYMLRIAFDKKFQNFIEKKNWLNDHTPVPDHRAAEPH